MTEYVCYFVWAKNVDVVHTVTCTCAVTLVYLFYRMATLHLTVRVMNYQEKIRLLPLLKVW